MVWNRHHDKRFLGAFRSLWHKPVKKIQRKSNVLGLLSHYLQDVNDANDVDAVSNIKPERNGLEDAECFRHFDIE